MKDFLYKDKRKWLSVALAILGIPLGFILMIVGGMFHFMLGIPGIAVLIASIVVLANAKVSIPNGEGKKETSIAHIIVGLALVAIIVPTGIYIAKNAFNDDGSTSVPKVEKPVILAQDIVITSQAVKLADGKYRYFFNVKNNSEQPFTGDIEITLTKPSGETVYSKTLTATQAVQPGFGTSVYIDAHTGPVAVHAANGVQGFTYEATVNDTVVMEGQGTITTQFGGM